MGYRSQVMFAVTEAAYNKHANQNVREALKDCDRAFEIEGAAQDHEGLPPKNNKIYYFYWDNVKWYPDYEDVKIVEDFIQKCEEDGDCGFLRIGEDEGDIERRGEPNEYEIYVTCSISSPGDSRQAKDVNKDILFACNSIRYIVEKE
jgi:hypothetical protein